MKQASKSAKQKPVANRDSAGRFNKGVSGNPRGRPRGSKSKTVRVTAKLKPVSTSGAKRKRDMPVPTRRPGRPKGSKNKATILREAIHNNAPDLFKRLMEVARSGDVPALKAVLGPLLPKGNTVPWKFGPLDTPDAITRESERVLRAMEDGQLTVDEAKAVEELLDHHLARTHTAGNRRSEFEQEELALSLIRSDERCRRLAMALCARFDELESQALESGKLTAPTSHPLIEAARTGVTKT